MSNNKLLIELINDNIRTIQQYGWSSRGNIIPENMIEDIILNNFQEFMQLIDYLIRNDNGFFSEEKYDYYFRGCPREIYMRLLYNQLWNNLNDYNKNDYRKIIIKFCCKYKNSIDNIISKYNDLYEEIFKDCTLNPINEIIYLNQLGCLRHNMNNYIFESKYYMERCINYKKMDVFIIPNDKMIKVMHKNNQILI